MAKRSVIGRVAQYRHGSSGSDSRLTNTERSIPIGYLPGSPPSGPSRFPSMTSDRQPADRRLLQLNAGGLETSPCPPHRHPDIGRNSETDVAPRCQHFATGIVGDPTTRRAGAPSSTNTYCHSRYATCPAPGRGGEAVRLPIIPISVGPLCRLWPGVVTERGRLLPPRAALAQKGCARSRPR